jgi:methylaspartate mutase epsilon subunit
LKSISAPSPVDGFMSTQQEGNDRRHAVLLGGLGGDAHSVGLIILREALTAQGYRVRYIGTQNSLEDFLHLAGLCNVVMISSMDGHARYYLREFPSLKAQLAAKGTLWYLGGNLHLGEGFGCEKEFMEMGFQRVFVKFVDLNSVLEILARDLSDVDAVADYPSLWEQSHPPTIHLPGRAADTLLEAGTFERCRREVLGSWKTGRGVKSLEENAQFLSVQPSFARVQRHVNGNSQQVLIQPRCGVPLVDQQIKLFQAFKRSGVRVLSYQVDSLTRNNNYAGAEEAIRESHATGRPSLNGFPVINHGVPGMREVMRNVRTPLQTRHSTRDPRLLAEISYAGGVTSFEGGAICYDIPYYKDHPLAESISNWQYVDYLTGLYYERFGIVLDREFFGTLTATLIPPCLAIVTNIIEALLAVRQGVRCVSLGYAEQGHRVQDIAAIRTMRSMAAELLANMSYKDVQINTVFYQYMAAFPADTERSAELIRNSATTAALSGATRVIGKTPVEALRIPDIKDNLAGIRLIHQGVSEAANHSVDELEVARECDLIRREVEAIFESIIYCGDGDLAQGVVSGFAKGYLDIPFSPSTHNRGEVMTARDVAGAVRFISTGNLQFGAELREFHREKAGERRRAAGLRSPKQDYLLVENDVMQVSRGQYERWPLSL